MSAPTSFAGLSDLELITAVKRLAAEEREATAALIASLIEVDARRLFRGEGCSSLFDYCTRVLRLSESAAYARIAAARAARRFPLVLERLERGDITLTTICLLAAHLNEENHRALLDSARHATKRQVEQLIASLRPQPDVPATIRKLPSPHASDAAITQLSEPPPAAMFDRALTLLVEHLERAKLGYATRPRTPANVANGSRNIPSSVKRAVWDRDAGCCSFNGREGRCTERGFLEFHHVVPYARGGKATVGNIQLRCRAHNQYEAEEAFGPRDLVVREKGPAYASSSPAIAQRRSAARSACGLALVPERVG